MIGKKRAYRFLSRRSCWRLAMLYREGLADGRWTTQLGALSTLGVSQGDLSLALQLEKLPEPIVDLFEDRIEISSHTVRVIRHTIIHDGLSTVLSRVQRSGVPSKTLSNKGVLRVIKGQALGSKKMLRRSGQDLEKIVARPLDLPAHIAERYYLGVKQGEWDSFSACAKALHISRRNISDAVAISELPVSIRHLFGVQALTLCVGRKLLALKRELGIDELLLRALCKESMLDVVGRTADNILLELNDEDIGPLDLRRVRIKKGRGSNRLVIECKDAALLFRYRHEMEGAIHKVLRRRLRDPESFEVIRDSLGTRRSVLPR
ncbi:hypothetical protein [Caballeronia sp. LZ016]|uniref:hypothetical protein n=1 Tax=Caballeronia sp. LZ016 TaxID=3038554 RepID=UPI00285D0E79|nr:hypothetical protein [Caballeronia sp. LZ016]MDR5737689.1 hypothetical protein [Caballeronia sp. LZ016]